jgi:thiol-disulfide isomerase/thioredoxin
MNINHWFRLLSFIFIAFIYSCSGDNKSPVITGRLNHADKKWIYLQRITEEGERTVDSTQTSSDGEFKLKNPADSVDFYILRTDNTNFIFLVLNKDEFLEINGDANNLQNSYEVKGSSDSKLLRLLRTYDSLLSDSLNKAYTEFRDSIPAKKDSLGIILQEFYTNVMEEYARNFIRQNLSSIVSLSATKFLNQHAEYSLLRELEDSLVKKYPGNKYVSDYQLLMAELNKLPPGSMAPEISMSNPEGKNISLSSLRGKIVLVDFWASWCLPCRKENPHLKEIYSKYKQKNFEILGVSLDDNAVAWKQAIQNDKLSWNHVSDLKKWKSSVVKDYSIEAIPFSVLVDKDGKIIARGLRPGELDLKISQALLN